MTNFIVIFKIHFIYSINLIFKYNTFYGESKGIRVWGYRFRKFTRRRWRRRRLLRCYMQDMLWRYDTSILHLWLFRFHQICPQSLCPEMDYPKNLWNKRGRDTRLWDLSLIIFCHPIERRIPNSILLFFWKFKEIHILRDGFPLSSLPFIPLFFLNSYIPVVFYYFFEFVW